MSNPHSLSKFTDYQKLVVIILIFLQFTLILDFMIIFPLGALVMPALKITPSQFGLVVSVYAFSAGVCGFLSAGFADRFDRKKLLLFFYVGFILGTLFCGLADTYPLLLAARMITGVFGGVIGSIVMAITTDLFSMEKRGRVMGYVQAAFGGAQVLGIPAGLFFSNLWGWHAPFFLIVAVGVLVTVAIWFIFRPIDEHLKLQSDRNVLVHLRNTVLNPHYTLAFMVTALLATGGYMLMPFGSAFTVSNLGISMDHLPLIYLVSGIAAMLIGPLVGRMSDKMGKLPVFLFGGIVSIIMVVIYTNLGINPLWLVMLVNVILFVGIFSRMIPAQALTSAIPTPANRGAFMAVSSALQQLSGGVASVIAGLVVVQTATGKIEHFNMLGYIICFTVGATMVGMYFIDRAVKARARTS